VCVLRLPVYCPYTKEDTFAPSKAITRIYFTDKNVATTL